MKGLSFRTDYINWFLEFIFSVEIPCSKCLYISKIRLLNRSEETFSFQNVEWSWWQRSSLTLPILGCSFILLFSIEWLHSPMTKAQNKNTNWQIHKGTFLLLFLFFLHQTHTHAILTSKWKGIKWKYFHCIYNFYICEYHVHQYHYFTWMNEYIQ